MVSKTQLHPAYAYIGQPEEIKAQAVRFIKSVLCPENGCNACIACTQIEQRQHHALSWFVPENTYTVAHLEPLFDTITFALEPDTHFFFVLERADALSITCANSLLKSLEEPPTGYHFILLSSSRDSLLPTVSSRCVIYYVDQQQELIQHPLVSYFTHFNAGKATAFIKELEKTKIAERDVCALLDAICQKLLYALHQALKEKDQEKFDILSRQGEILDRAREQLPMPGSSKLFFKNLFLQFLVLK